MSVLHREPLGDTERPMGMTLHHSPSTSRSVRRLAAAACAVGLLTVAAGCGDDETSSDTTTAAAADSTAAPVATPAPTAPAAPAAVVVPPAGDGDKDGVPDGEDKCPASAAGAKVMAQGCRVSS